MNTASPDDIDITAVWRSLRRALPKLLAAEPGGRHRRLRDPVASSRRATPPKRRSRSWRPNASRRAMRSAEAVAARLDKEAINTHVRALHVARSRASRSSPTEGLANKPEFNSALQPPTLARPHPARARFRPRNEESEQERVLQGLSSTASTSTRPRRAASSASASPPPTPSSPPRWRTASPRPTARSLATRTVARDRRGAAGAAAEDRQAR